MAPKRKYRVFVVMPFWQGYDAVYSIIRESVQRAESRLEGTITCSRLDVPTGRMVSPVKALHDAIRKADLIIADISLQRPNVMMEIGIAKGLAKQIILLSQGTEEIPFNLRANFMHVYETGRALSGLLPRLTESIIRFLEASPQNQRIATGSFSAHSAQQRPRGQVFISYSHEDIRFLYRLLVHLRPFEKKGLLDLWADTKIRPGDNWKSEISSALSRAKVAILLVTADFLASDFIVENELPPLLVSAEKEGVRIIPVVLKPCSFLRDDNLSKFQAINDPMYPLMKLSEVEQEEIYARIADAVAYG